MIRPVLAASAGAAAIGVSPAARTASPAPAAIRRGEGSGARMGAPSLRFDVTDESSPMAHAMHPAAKDLFSDCLPKLHCLFCEVVTYASDARAPLPPHVAEELVARPHRHGDGGGQHDLREVEQGFP